MMESVPRPRPPHLHRQITRHGKAVWYVRIDKGKRIRIRSEFGTPEFDSEYQVAIAGTPRRKTNAPPLGTLTWLIDRYRESAAWSVLSPGTRRQRENIFYMCWKLRGTNRLSRSTPPQSMPVWNVAPRHRFKLATFLTPCAACSNGQ
jgi:hypothetical protein